MASQRVRTTAAGESGDEWLMTMPAALPSSPSLLVHNGNGFELPRGVLDGDELAALGAEDPVRGGHLGAVHEPIEPGEVARLERPFARIRQMGVACP